MYRKVSDFLEDWKSETDSTLKVFSGLTDECLNKKFHENVRSAGRIAWHMVLTIVEMAQLMGLKISALEKEAPMPATVRELIDKFNETASGLYSGIEKNWTDETLLREDDLFGELWKRGKSLSVIMAHHIHHLGQLTVVMRFAGLKVPGVYGPAKEEWADYGMDPQE
ncbi:DinB family protein [Melioribacter roseus P3M-2]|uniref:DinB family protein n=1 Tax=Melioribacter roseus (strain DSM 23840 / JCM 17771 / VKM B-2668 / P3M-2) TaxID=1191523 RepID=I6Z6Y3_MELRP|nr:DinB family protein [Melioribacter roseus]AFN74905.1 DinB family protein [Melioribacter roseus P3M-2]